MALQDFIHKYPKSHYKAGMTILEKGAVPDCAYVVASGAVKVYTISAQGEERPVLFDIAYEIFPIGWVFGKIKQTYFYYDALVDTEVYKIPREDFLDFLQTDPAEMYKALDYYIDRHVGSQMRIHALSQSKAVEKIAFTLEFFGRRFGTKRANDRIFIKLPLTHQDIGNFVGLTRETASIELKKLQDEKVIKYKKQHYEINMKKLDELLEQL